MKNLIFALAILVLLLCIGCEDEIEAVNCISLANTFTTTSQAFLEADAGIEECQANADAIVALIESECEGFSLDEMGYTQSGLDSLKDGSYCALLYP